MTEKLLTGTLSLNTTNHMQLQNWADKIVIKISLISVRTEAFPKYLSGKKLLKNVTLQIFKFYPGKLTNRNFPYGVMLNFLCFLVLFNAVKTDTKLTLHHMGKNFII